MHIYEKLKNDFEKDLLKLINNAVFQKKKKGKCEKTDIKLAAINARRNYLV